MRNACVKSCSASFERLGSGAGPTAPERSQGLRERPGSAVIADVVSEGAAERGKRTLRAELALKTVTAELDPRERLRRVLEQVLVFTGTAFAAVYSPSESGDELHLAEYAGVPRTLYGLRDSYPLSGGSPAVDAHRSGRPSPHRYR